MTTQLAGEAGNCNYQRAGAWRRRAALEAGGVTLAVLPGPVERIYPSSHSSLARRIVEQGGALLITEAALKNGSLHTARFALEAGKDVLAVPGNITNEMSVGTNNLLRNGATPVTCVEDVVHVLNLKPPVKGANSNEQLLIDLLAQDIADGAELLETSNLEVGEFNQTLTMLEITSKIRSLGANQWSL